MDQIAPFGHLDKIEPLSNASIRSRDRTGTVSTAGCIVAIAGIRVDRYSVKKCAASSMLIKNIAATDALAT
ncbi:MAG: hypothetical protein KGK01_02155 [Bradyrhizobium sp.]|uniref:hypothetical protein n=1 Tax=Bradyrhizobium sp. TaxID=376 RepID=UPI001C299774|nr:hypothetical protein [Bradyrhizobium sp.]MBU6461921.1 hypothetical protein [Pseudomonadota bacterium]MDE2066898.1 hypothetical protein [Bradyrhizobium sp.]MDE2241267.1 hypothetical protein [Bradyrhizobium sp.]